MEARILINLLLIIILHLAKSQRHERPSGYYHHRQDSSHKEKMDVRFGVKKYVTYLIPLTYHMLNAKVADFQKDSEKPLFNSYHGYKTLGNVFPRHIANQATKTKNEDVGRANKGNVKFNGPTYEVIKHINCKINTPLCPFLQKKSQSKIHNKLYYDMAKWAVKKFLPIEKGQFEKTAYKNKKFIEKLITEGKNIINIGTEQTKGLIGFAIKPMKEINGKDDIKEMYNENQPTEKVNRFNIEVQPVSKPHEVTVAQFILNQHKNKIEEEAKLDHAQNGSLKIRNNFYNTTNEELTKDKANIDVQQNRKSPVEYFVIELADKGERTFNESLEGAVINNGKTYEKSQENNATNDLHKTKDNTLKVLQTVLNVNEREKINTETDFNKQQLRRIVNNQSHHAEEEIISHSPSMVTNIKDNNPKDADNIKIDISSEQTEIQKNLEEDTILIIENVAVDSNIKNMNGSDYTEMEISIIDTSHLENGSIVPLEKEKVAIIENFPNENPQPTIIKIEVDNAESDVARDATKDEFTEHADEHKSDPTEAERVVNIENGSVVVSSKMNENEHKILKKDSDNRDQLQVEMAKNDEEITLKEKTEIVSEGTSQFTLDTDIHKSELTEAERTADIENGSEIFEGRTIENEDKLLTENNNNLEQPAGEMSVKKVDLATENKKIAIEDIPEIAGNSLITKPIEDVGNDYSFKSLNIENEHQILIENDNNVELLEGEVTTEKNENMPENKELIIGDVPERNSVITKSQSNETERVINVENEFVVFKSINDANEHKIETEINNKMELAVGEITDEMDEREAETVTVDVKGVSELVFSGKNQSEPLESRTVDNIEKNLYIENQHKNILQNGNNEEQFTVEKDQPAEEKTIDFKIDTELSVYFNKSQDLHKGLIFDYQQKTMSEGENKEGQPTVQLLIGENAKDIEEEEKTNTIQEVSDEGGQLESGILVNPEKDLLDEVKSIPTGNEENIAEKKELPSAEIILENDEKDITAEEKTITIQDFPDGGGQLESGFLVNPEKDLLDQVKGVPTGNEENVALENEELSPEEVIVENDENDITAEEKTITTQDVRDEGEQLESGILVNPEEDLLDQVKSVPTENEENIALEKKELPPAEIILENDEKDITAEENTFAIQDVPDGGGQLESGILVNPEDLLDQVKSIPIENEENIALEKKELPPAEIILENDEKDITAEEKTITTQDVRDEGEQLESGILVNPEDLLDQVKNIPTENEESIALEKKELPPAEIILENYEKDITAEEKTITIQDVPDGGEQLESGILVNPEEDLLDQVKSIPIENEENIALEKKELPPAEIILENDEKDITAEEKTITTQDVPDGGGQFESGILVSPEVDLLDQVKSVPTENEENIALEKKELPPAEIILENDEKDIIAEEKRITIPNVPDGGEQLESGILVNPEKDLLDQVKSIPTENEENIALEKKELPPVETIMEYGDENITAEEKTITIQDVPDGGRKLESGFLVNPKKDLLGQVKSIPTEIKEKILLEKNKTKEHPTIENISAEVKTIDRVSEYSNEKQGELLESGIADNIKKDFQDTIRSISVENPHKILLENDKNEPTVEKEITTEEKTTGESEPELSVKSDITEPIEYGQEANTEKDFQAKIETIVIQQKIESDKNEEQSTAEKDYKDISKEEKSINIELSYLNHTEPFKSEEKTDTPTTTDSDVIHNAVNKEQIKTDNFMNGLKNIVNNDTEGERKTLIEDIIEKQHTNKTDSVLQANVRKLNLFEHFADIATRSKDERNGTENSYSNTQNQITINGTNEETIADLQLDYSEQSQFNEEKAFMATGFPEPAKSINSSDITKLEHLTQTISNRTFIPAEKNNQLKTPYAERKHIDYSKKWLTIQFENKTFGSTKKRLEEEKIKNSEGDHEVKLYESKTIIRHNDKSEPTEVPTNMEDDKKEKTLDTHNKPFKMDIFRAENQNLKENENNHSEIIETLDQKGPTELDIIEEENKSPIKRRHVRSRSVEDDRSVEEGLLPSLTIKDMSDSNMTENMRSFLNQLDKDSILDVISSMKRDHLAKAKPEDKQFLEETFEKLRLSVLNMDQDSDMTNLNRKAHMLTDTGSVLGLLAEESSIVKSTEDYDSYYYSDASQEESDEAEPSFLEMLSIASRHKEKHFSPKNQ
ncbi:titin-like [Cimex lectularius]|uniref:Uncharacterized protein n=1 Tax=Cimex lectularius TaxID=79782 RepID=A0A8I6R9C4_CIMLE|nr:titin-like [Cimex lectularius]